jgi:citrate synthase
MLGCVPAVAACIYNVYTNNANRSFSKPPILSEKAKSDPNLGYIKNFCAMVFGIDHEYTNNPKIIRAIEVLFILHAEHELNCSTAAVRHM